MKRPIKTKKMCAGDLGDGCPNPAEYIVVNGNDKDALCRPCFQERLLDLVVNNDTITTWALDEKENGLPVIEVQ